MFTRFTSTTRYIFRARKTPSEALQKYLVGAPRVTLPWYCSTRLRNEWYLVFSQPCQTSSKFPCCSSLVTAQSLQSKRRIWWIIWARKTYPPDRSSRKVVSGISWLSWFSRDLYFSCRCYFNIALKNILFHGQDRICMDRQYWIQNPVTNICESFVPYQSRSSIRNLCIHSVSFHIRSFSISIHSKRSGSIT